MIDRYHRQTILPGFGPAAAARLARAHAMIIGCGALGCPAADLLARAGVGRLTLLDRDVVEITNLQRQTLFAEADAHARRPKALAAAARLSSVNSSIVIDAIVEDFDADAAPRMLASHPPPDVVLDCTDNFETRYIINDACVQAAVPLVYGGAVGTAGMNFVAAPASTSGAQGDGPCLRCLFPDPPSPGEAPTCDTAGILGPVAAIVGARQAADALRVLVLGASSVRRVLTSLDAWTGSTREIDLRAARRSDCPCCGRRDFEFLRPASDPGCGTRAQPTTRVLCGRNAVQVTGRVGPADIDLAALADRLSRAGAGEFEPGGAALQGVLRVDGREHPLTVFADGRAIIGNTTDPAVAKGLYARFVG